MIEQEGASGVVDGSAAFAHCRNVTREHARNFYYGLKLLPEPKRSSLYVIYAWMRRADDIVDDAAPGDAGAATRLDELAHATRRALGGKASPDDPVLIALADVAERYALEAAPFDAMIEGQRTDLARPRFETAEELITYCEQVASSVGQVCISIWGYKDKRAKPLATDRGIAFQLTNILRDVAEDAKRDRVYLPAEHLARHGLTLESLLAWSDRMRCSRFVVEQVDRAEAYYARSQPLEEMIEPDCRATLWAMTSIYHRLLDQLRASPDRIARGRRVHLSPWTKSAIAMKARWYARSRGS